MNDAIIYGYRLPTVEDTGNAPNRVIFREIDIVGEFNGNPDHVNVVYLNDDPPLQQSIDDFLETVSPYSPSAALAAAAAAPAALDPTSPLDLNCKEDCYVVFLLSSLRNWQFAERGDCFTTKNDLGPKYTNLVHVMPDGKKLGTNTKIGKGCRLLYFRATCNSSQYNDGFNLVVELNLGYYEDTGGTITKRRTCLVIDPDIRNPGGSSG